MYMYKTDVQESNKEPFIDFVLIAVTRQTHSTAVL